MKIRSAKILLVISIVLLVSGCIGTIYTNAQTFNTKDNKVQEENKEPEIEELNQATYRCYRHNNDILEGNIKYTKYYQFEVENNITETKYSKFVMIYQFPDKESYDSFDIHKFSEYALIKDEEELKYTFADLMAITDENHKETYSLDEYLAVLRNNDFNDCKKID